MLKILQDKNPSPETPNEDKEVVVSWNEKTNPENEEPKIPDGKRGSSLSSNWARKKPLTKESLHSSNLYLSHNE